MWFAPGLVLELVFCSLACTNMQENKVQWGSFTKAAVRALGRIRSQKPIFAVMASRLQHELIQSQNQLLRIAGVHGCDLRCICRVGLCAPWIRVARSSSAMHPSTWYDWYLQFVAQVKKIQSKSPE